MLSITGSNVTIMVMDMDRSIEFYQKIGLTLKQRWGNHYAMVETTGITIGIHPASTAEVSSGTVSVGFMIQSLDEAKALLTAGSISFKEENDGKSGIYLHFKDPDNTILYYVLPQW